MAEESLKRDVTKGEKSLQPDLKKSSSIRSRRKRLILREEVDRVFRKGKKLVSDKVILFHLENRFDFFRYAIHTRKKLGYAVERNRTKRLFREALLRQRSLSGQDLIFIPRKEVKGSTLQEISDLLERMLGHAGILKEK